MSLFADSPGGAGSRDRAAVGVREILTLASAVFAGTAILLFLLAGILKITRHSKLEHVQSALEKLAPHAEQLRAVKEAVIINDKMIAAVDEWMEPGSPPMYRILRAVQENIPPQIVLYHVAAGIEEAVEDSPPARTLYLSGTAEGELVTVETKRRLNADADLHNFCGEIKFALSQRHSSKSWAFAFEGRHLSGAVEQ